MNQDNKALVWRYWQQLAGQAESDLYAQTFHRDVSWHGFAPLRRLRGRSELWDQFWRPLFAAMPDLSRRPYHFIGGHFEGGEWVCGTGDFIGTFAHDWQLRHVNIPASGSTVQLTPGPAYALRCKMRKRR